MLVTFFSKLHLLCIFIYIYYIFIYFLKICNKHLFLGLYCSAQYFQHAFGAAVFLFLFKDLATDLFLCVSVCCSIMTKNCENILNVA